MGESGEKVKIDPETYKIVDGKLFCSTIFGVTIRSKIGIKVRSHLSPKLTRTGKKSSPNVLVEKLL